MRTITVRQLRMSKIFPDEKTFDEKIEKIRRTT